MFSEVAEIALVATRLGQFQQLLKTRVILILNFTRPRAITYTNCVFTNSSPVSLSNTCSYASKKKARTNDGDFRGKIFHLLAEHVF